MVVRLLATVGMIIVLMAYVAISPAGAAKIWDAGAAITGELETKIIEIAASSDDGDSTDTMSVFGVEDSDHWVDAEESTTTGTDGDEPAGWSPTGCWWNASAGSVTQGDPTTTWTAPYKQGTAAYVRIGLDDLPKPLGPGDTGSRDDLRTYVGSEEPNAYSLWVAWHANTSGPTHGSPQFVFGPQGPGGTWTLGDGTTLGIVNPDTSGSNGFFKKIELVGVLSPTLAGRTFSIAQDVSWVQKANGQVISQDATSDTTPVQNTTDQDGKIFVWDGPGFSLIPYGGEWRKPEGNTHVTSFEVSMSFSDFASYQGRRASDDFPWSRHVLLEGDDGELNFNNPATINE